MNRIGGETASDFNVLLQYALLVRSCRQDRPSAVCDQLLVGDGSADMARAPDAAPDDEEIFLTTREIKRDLVPNVIGFLRAGQRLACTRTGLPAPAHWW